MFRDDQTPVKPALLEILIAARNNIGPVKASLTMFEGWLDQMSKEDYARVKLT